MPVTQKQIAERLNISRSWVARALNGYDTVSPEMRERVQAVAKEMGYDLGTNQAARSLIAKRYGQRVKTDILAVAFPPMVSKSARSMPFFTPFLEGMESEAAKLNLDVFAFQMRYGELPRLIRERGVDGVVSIGFLEHEVQQFRELDLPVVTYQVEYPNAHSLMIDDFEASRLLTRHLLELGHREIAFMGVQRQWNTGQANALRQEGYEAALAEYGVPVRPEWIDVSCPIPDTTAHQHCVGCDKCAACVGWQALLNTAGVTASNVPFTAIVCHSDMVAIGIIQSAQEAGLSVPEQLSIVGFDDVSHFYHFEPQITSVGFDRFAMGEHAARLLYKSIDQDSAIEEDDGDLFEHSVFPVSLACHDSAAPPVQR